MHLGADVPKYINSSGNPLIYTKGGTLFGLNFAYRHIRNTDMSVLVEGNADVVKMHQLGVCNVTAPCGTALTDEQIRLLGRASKNVTLMLDGDDAGAKATERNGKRLVESGMNVYVLEIPAKEDGSKQDPDSYFTSKEQFEEFQHKTRLLFLEALARKKQADTQADPIAKTAAVREISALFADRPIADRNSLIERLSKIIPGKNIWKQILLYDHPQSLRLAHQRMAVRTRTPAGGYGGKVCRHNLSIYSIHSRETPWEKDKESVRTCGDTCRTATARRSPSISSACRRAG